MTSVTGDIRGGSRPERRGMQMLRRKARMVVLAGLVAGSVGMLAVPSPAGAVGARPEDPTTAPMPTAPLPTAPLPPAPLPPAPAPVPAPAPPAPAPPVGPQPAPRKTVIRPAEPVEYAWWY